MKKSEFIFIKLLISFLVILNALTILIPDSNSLIILERSAILKLALLAFLLMLYPIFKMINPASGIVNKTNYQNIKDGQKIRFVCGVNNYGTNGRSKYYANH